MNIVKGLYNHVIQKEREGERGEGQEIERHRNRSSERRSERQIERES